MVAERSRETVRPTVTVRYVDVTTTSRVDVCTRVDVEPGTAEVYAAAIRARIEAAVAGVLRDVAVDAGSAR